MRLHGQTERVGNRVQLSIVRPERHAGRQLDFFFNPMKACAFAISSSSSASVVRILVSHSGTFIASFDVVFTAEPSNAAACLTTHPLAGAATERRDTEWGA